MVLFPAARVKHRRAVGISRHRMLSTRHPRRSAAEDGEGALSGGGRSSGNRGSKGDGTLMDIWERPSQTEGPAGTEALWVYRLHVGGAGLAGRHAGRCGIMACRTQFSSRCTSW